MAFGVHGNLAVKQEDVSRNVYRKKTQTVVSKKKTISAPEKLLYLIAIIFCVVIAGFVILKNAQIYEVNTQMQQISLEIQKLEKENKNLKLEVRKMEDPKRLIEYAESQNFVLTEETNVLQISPTPNQSEEDQNIAYTE
ncbi:cell division protein FtsL [Chengkuizengella axinellae]|uniref:Cell division protein FtsL n=1 Tax=Chengkuizengella axinellae TaxID=3064388 RepID=A0ABT9IWG0_9BACL|nr:cell division protein FtsL [Chengkuizengella sp. 2205SS18-9]MDP5273149.1 cell division protein FtsL [Chengkuizengella sp. 2205SS18-9]